MQTDKIYQLLKKHFGYTSFRPNQQEAVEMLLAGKDLFACMPTGGGKSLCYQLTALALEGVTVVISPLISLMKDQVDAALKRGISAAYIGSLRSNQENRTVYQQLFHKEIKILYLSPERILLDGFCEFLSQFSIALFAIDEAHCISEWGTGFREEYNKLSLLKEFFPHVPIGAFTATATQKVQSDIIEKLQLKNPHIIRASFDRPELLYRIVPREKEGFLQIVEAINRHPQESGIIYLLSQAKCEKVAEKLQRKGIKALPYHGGLSAKERTENQNAFQEGSIQVICATVAFGMGIDKSDVRFVIHAQLPASIESYYQETGRAGRDGKEAECLWLFNAGDWGKRQYLIEHQNSNQKKNDHSIEKYQKEAMKRLHQVIQLGKSSRCRRKELLSYFSEEYNQENCHHCDICLQETLPTEGASFAKPFLSLMQSTGERFGKNYIISLLLGKNGDPRVSKNRHDQLPFFGIGINQKESFWLSLYDILVEKGWIYIDTTSGYPILKLSMKGESFLEGSLMAKKGEILLPISETLLLAKGKAPKKPKKSRKEDSFSLSSKKEETIFQELKKLRLKIAHKQQCPAFIVFTDKTLLEIAIRKPKTKSQWLDIYGISETKWEKYGQNFLDLIDQYR